MGAGRDYRSDYHKRFRGSHHPTWQGIGMGLTLFGHAGLAVDYISQNRADAYYEVIIKALN